MRKFLVIKRAESLEKTEVSTAGFNDYPDASFAYIEPGGSKDDEGKTTPRSKRHLPYRKKDGKTPDRAHVQNALARLNQTDIPASAKASAKRKLLAAAKQLGMETSEETQKDAMGMPHAEPDGDETPPMDYATRLEQFRADVEDLLDQVGLAKVDAALEELATLAKTETPSAARQAQLHTTFAALQAMVWPQDDPPTKGARMADKDVSEVQKQELEALRKRADKAEARATALQTELETSKAELAKSQEELRKARQTPEEQEAEYEATLPEHVRKKRQEEQAELVAMRKRLQEADERVEKSDYVQKAAALQAIGFVPDKHWSILKGINGMPEEDRTELLRILAANAEQLRTSALFKAVGSNGNGQAMSAGSGTAEDQLLALAKAYAEEHKCDMLTAQEAVARAHRDLYDKSVLEKRHRTRVASE
jgi:hypothetical protein